MEINQNLNYCNYLLQLQRISAAELQSVGNQELTTGAILKNRKTSVPSPEWLLKPQR